MPTILVADDNSNIQKMVSLVFKEKGFRVVAVGNGEAACRKVPEVRPDVVLADVFMPVRNGYEVCEFVKQDPQFAETPVVLLVGAFDPLDEKEAQRVGANGVLKKPFVPPEPLIAMVSSLLGKTEVPVEETQPSAEAAPKIELPPPLVPAPRQVPQEFAFGSSDEKDEAVSTFGNPVATPSAETSELVEEDYPAQETEWSKRRATLDYQIDAADSANLVEKLAAEGMTEETEIHATNKHLPFGGANVPEAVPEALPESRPNKWLSLKSQETTLELPTEAEPITLKEEAVAPPIREEENAPSFSDAQRGPELDSMDKMQIASPPVVQDIAPAEEPAPETSNLSSADPALIEQDPMDHPGDAIRQLAPTPWPVPSRVTSNYPESTLSSAEEAHQPVLQDMTEKVSEPVFTVPERTVYGASNDGDDAALEFTEPTPSSATTKVDQATVDDMVAKVISKLEPQLHEALANGVLRPLVEELLNLHRDKK